MTRGAAIPAALAVTLLLLASCSRDAPAPAPAEADNELTVGAADYPPAVRQPTQAEAERIGAECGTRVRPARMPDGLLRLAAWAVYEPVDATPAQRECFYHRIRLLVAQPA